MIDRLEQLEKAATPGPWKVGRLGPGGKIRAVLAYDPPIEDLPGEWLGAAYFCDYQGNGESVGMDNDPALIAALRNAAPALLALARAAEDRVSVADICCERDVDIVAPDAIKGFVAPLREALAQLKGSSDA